MVLNRFQRSPLGVFVRSPLGARGGAAVHYHRLRRCWNACPAVYVYVPTNRGEPGDRFRYNGACHQVLQGAASTCVNLPRADILVSGAGTAAANGTYETFRNATWPHPNDGERWDYDSGAGAITYNAGLGRWTIYGGAYYVENTDLEPPTTGWQQGTGALPVPTVAYTWTSGDEPDVLTAGNSAHDNASCCNQELLTLDAADIIASDQCCGPDTLFVWRRASYALDVNGEYDDSGISCETGPLNVSRAAAPATVNTYVYHPHDPCLGTPAVDSQATLTIYSVIDGALGIFDPITIEVSSSSIAFTATGSFSAVHANGYDAPGCDRLGYSGTLTTVTVETGGPINCCHWRSPHLFSAGDIARPEQGKREESNGALDAPFADDGLGNPVPDFSFVRASSAAPVYTVIWCEASAGDVYRTDEVGNIVWNVAVSGASCADYGSSYDGSDEIAVGGGGGVTFLNYSTGATKGTNAAGSVTWLVPLDAAGSAYFVTLSASATPVKRIDGAVTDWSLDLSGTGATQTALMCSLKATATATLFVATQPIGAGNLTLHAVNIATQAIIAALAVPGATSVFFQTDDGTDNVYVGTSGSAVHKYSWDGAGFTLVWTWAPLPHGSINAISGDGTDIYVSLSAGAASYGGLAGCLYRVYGDAGCPMWKVDRRAGQT